MNLLMEFFGDRQLSEISEELVEEYKVWRKGQRKKSHGEGAPKGATINRELKLLSRVCKYAVKRGYLREDPTRNVEYYREKQEKITVISKKDFYERFLPHCNSRNQYAMTEFYDFAFRTGTRRSEITGLKWSEVDFQAGHIAFIDTKNGEVKYFPMTKYIREILERLYETRISEYVFPNNGGGRRADVRTAFKMTLKRAGLPEMRLHDLRHSFVAMCASMGMAWEQTSALTGHKTYAAYRRYEHLFETEQKRLLERWDEP
jgi:integrase